MASLVAPGMMRHMSAVLSEALLSKAAGWEAMKQARAYLAQGQVVSSFWEPPLLRGVVQAGEISFRASMVIKGPIDIENLCTCRDSRQWGKICAHSVAVGLHWLANQSAAANPPRSNSPTQTSKPTRTKQGVLRSSNGEPAELFVIFPPNLESAIARGKVMLVFEARWRSGRGPLNSLPKQIAFTFSRQDDALLERL